MEKDPTFRRIRVVHVITMLELGGAQINTIHTYENLDPDQFEAYLLSGGGGILDRRVEGTENFHRIKSLIRPLRPWADTRAFLQLRKILKNLRPHIVHTHSSKAGILGRLAAKSVGVPVIIHTVHGFSFSPFQSLIKRIFYQTAEKLVSSLTTHFIFVSREDMEAAVNLRLVKNNHSLIRSGFPFDQFVASNIQKRSIRLKYNLPEKSFICGIVAPFKPQKGLLHLINIAARVIKNRKNVLFVLVGDGEQRKSIEAELQRRTISANFRLPGFIEPIGPIMDTFDCALSTSLWEGLPQSLVQFRLKQIPVLASDIPGNREVIQNNKNGFLIPVEDHETFCDKLLYLIDNPSERKRLGSFKDDFSEWRGETMIRRQEKLYLSLIPPDSESRRSR